MGGKVTMRVDIHKPEKVLSFDDSNIYLHFSIDTLLDMISEM